ncbi:MAG: dynamin family protein [Candidatus Ozemobacteraceae bacterium]
MNALTFQELCAAAGLPKNTAPEFLLPIDLKSGSAPLGAGLLALTAKHLLVSLPAGMTVMEVDAVPLFSVIPPRLKLGIVFQNKGMVIEACPSADAPTEALGKFTLALELRSCGVMPPGVRWDCLPTESILKSKASEALERCEQVKKLFPESLEADLWCVRLLLLTEKWEEARHHLEESRVFLSSEGRLLLAELAVLSSLPEVAEARLTSLPFRALSPEEQHLLRLIFLQERRISEWGSNFPDNGAIESSAIFWLDWYNAWSLMEGGSWFALRQIILPPRCDLLDGWALLGLGRLDEAETALSLAGNYGHHSSGNKGPEIDSWTTLDPLEILRLEAAIAHRGGNLAKAFHLLCTARCIDLVYPLCRLAIRLEREEELFTFFDPMLFLADQERIFASALAAPSPQEESSRSQVQSPFHGVNTNMDKTSSPPEKSPAHVQMRFNGVGIPLPDGTFPVKWLQERAHTLLLMMVAFQETGQKKALSAGMPLLKKNLSLLGYNNQALFSLLEAEIAWDSQDTRGTHSIHGSQRKCPASCESGIVYGEENGNEKEKENVDIEELRIYALSLLEREEMSDFTSYAFSREMIRARLILLGSAIALHQGKAETALAQLARIGPTVRRSGFDRLSKKWESLQQHAEAMRNENERARIENLLRHVATQKNRSAHLATQKNAGNAREQLFSIIRTLSLMQSRMRSVPELKKFGEPLADLLDDARRPLLVAVMGECKAGKSTLLNALLDFEALPVGAVPTTAVPCIVRFGNHPSALCFHGDGHLEPIDPEALHHHVDQHFLSQIIAGSEVALSTEGKADASTQSRAESDGNFSLARGADARAEAVTHIELSLPLPLLADVGFVDTPGLNSLFAAHQKASLNFLSHADTILWVFDATQTGRRSEIEIMKGLVLQGYSIIGVVNRIDEVEAEEIEEIRSSVEELTGLSSVMPVSSRLSDDSPDSLYSVARLRDRLQSEWCASADLIKVSRLHIRATTLLDEISRDVQSEITRLEALKMRGELLREVANGLSVEAMRFFEAWKKNLWDNVEKTVRLETPIQQQEPRSVDEDSLTGSEDRCYQGPGGSGTTVTPQAEKELRKAGLRFPVARRYGLLRKHFGEKVTEIRSWARSTAAPFFEHWKETAAATGEPHGPAFMEPACREHLEGSALSGLAVSFGSFSSHEPGVKESLKDWIARFVMQVKQGTEDSLDRLEGKISVYRHLILSPIVGLRPLFASAKFKKDS